MGGAVGCGVREVLTQQLLFCCHHWPWQGAAAWGSLQGQSRPQVWDLVQESPFPLPRKYPLQLGLPHPPSRLSKEVLSKGGGVSTFINSGIDHSAKYLPMARVTPWAGPL